MTDDTDFSSFRRPKSTLEIAVEQNNEVEVRRIMSHDKTFDDVKNDVFNYENSYHKGTVLHWSAYKGYTLTARSLIDRGVHVNVYDYKESTPLHSACREGHIDMVRLLLEKGARVDVMDVDNATPLNEAVRGGYIDIAMLLVNNGTQVIDGSMGRDEQRNDYPAQIIKILEDSIKEREEILRKAIAHDKTLNDIDMQSIETLKLLKGE